MLNVKMEILGKAEINNLVAENMYKAGIDAVASAIQNIPRFLAILLASTLNEYLEKQTETFNKIIEDNAERLNQKATKLSIIAEILQVFL